MVRAIVDLPVPAKPLSQKMHLSFCPSAHCLYLTTDIDTGVGKARRIVLLVVRVEGGLLSKRQL